MTSSSQSRRFAQHTAAASSRRLPLHSRREHLLLHEGRPALCVLCMLEERIASVVLLYDSGVSICSFVLANLCMLCVLRVLLRHLLVPLLAHPPPAACALLLMLRLRSIETAVGTLM